MSPRVLVPVLLVVVAAVASLLVWQFAADAPSDLPQKNEPHRIEPPPAEKVESENPPPAVETAGPTAIEPATTPEGAPVPRPAQRLALHLVDAVTEKPIAHHTVQLDGKEGRSDDKGRIFLPPQLVRTHGIQAAGYTAARIRLKDAKESGGRRTLSLYPTATITGRVLDGRNRPLVGARVAAGLPVQMWMTPDLGVKAIGQAWHTEAGPGGRFKLEDLPASLPLMLTAQPEGIPRIAVEKSVILEARETRTVNITGAIRGTITGRVVDQHGRAVAEARVGVREGREYPAGRGHSGRSDKNGRFRFTGVACGPCSVSVTAEKRGPKELCYQQVRVAVTLPTEQRAVDVTVVVPRGLYVSGFVRSVDGSPIAGAWVHSRHAFWQKARAKSGKNGEFTLGPLPGGKCRLWALRTGEYLTSPEQTVRPEARDVVLTMRRGMIITGIAVEAGTGKPIAGCKLEAMPRDSRFTTSWGTARKDGRFRMQSLRPGAYDLVARGKLRYSTTKSNAAGGITVTSDVRPLFGAVTGITVGDGRASKDVRIELLPGGTLKLVVDDRRKDRSYDRVKRNYRVYVKQHGLDVTGRSSYYGSGGLIPVPAGSLRVVITDHEDKRWKQEKDVVVPARKTVEVAFTLR